MNCGFKPTFTFTFALFCIVKQKPKKRPEQKVSEQDQVILCKERVTSQNFPTYAPPNIKDDMVSTV